MFWKSLLPVLVVALGIRVAAGAWWQERLPDQQRFGFPDSESYWKLAERVAQGESYELNPDRRVFRTPGYPLLLAPLFILAGGEPPVFWARVLGAVLGTAAVAAVAALAWQLFDRRAAVLAAWAAALYPEAVAMSTFVLSEAPFVPLMILQLLLATLAWRHETRRGQAAWASAAGLAAGAATLMRPSWLLFTPLALSLAFLDANQRPRAVRVGAWMLLALAAAMAPWWIRNALVTGRFVPTTLQVGESLYDGWNPQATGASDMRFVDEFRRELRRQDAARGIPTTESGLCFEQRLDQRMRDAAWDWAAEHPAEACRLAGVKFLRIWNVWPNEPSLGHWRFGLLVLAGYVPLLVGGLYGAWCFAGRGWPYQLCFLPALYFTVLHMVFVGSIRYRQPPMLALLVLAAGVAGQWVGRVREKQQESANR
ncbi:MAG: glycosyltransferase family 39 protein [Pirellulaceae bacterium]|nr:glycosyltransferase family 39 protein [Pirellulaceae bacterium]